MHRTSSLTGPGSQFDVFLFALVGEDSNGLPLSVVSALARMDIDPWEEAAKLAELPPDIAIQRLTDLFSAIPDETLGSSERSVIANRLIALLQHRPRFRPRAGPDMPTPETPAMAGIQPRTYALLFALYVFLFLLFTQINMSRRHPQTQDGIDHVALSATVPSHPD